MEMQNVWGLPHPPYPFQIQCVCSLVSPYHQVPPKVLSVQANGKGKYLCMQTAGTILRGVTLVIVPLLALGADQVTKISRVNQAYGGVHGYHLDDIKEAWSQLGGDGQRGLVKEKAVRVFWALTWGRK
eukprot:scaffold75818_cov54-Attheya_sp.AAC.1